MRIAISDFTMEETDQCPHDFRCLETGQCETSGTCEVEDADGQNILLLECNEWVNCPYQVSFGKGLLCTCPTHYAICTQNLQ
jgi:hypothetical protein